MPTEPQEPLLPAVARAASLTVLALTWGRLVLALVFPALPQRWWLPVVVAAGLSDLFDGWLSRRARVHSTFGQVLDPIADKLFVAAVVGSLWRDGLLPAWQIPLVGFRDLAVVAGSVWEVSRGGWGAVTELPPSLLGKAATVAQFVFLAALLYDRDVAPAACAVTVVLSVAAGAGYLLRPPPRHRPQGG